jgi:hypothetical protein
VLEQFSRKEGFAHTSSNQTDAPDGRLALSAMPLRFELHALLPLRATLAVGPVFIDSEAIRSASMAPPPTHETGHFYFAQNGHSHLAATPSCTLRTASSKTRRSPIIQCIRSRSENVALRLVRFANFDRANSSAEVREGCAQTCLQVVSVGCLRENSSRNEGSGAWHRGAAVLPGRRDADETLEKPVRTFISP